jgi:uncharacterized membrane protein (UPF0182 family)
VSFLFAVIVFAIGLIPLIVVRRKKAKLSDEAYQRRLRGPIIVLILDVLIIIAFFVFVNLYTDFLWFKNIGYAGRFLTVLRFEVLLYFAGALSAFFFLFFTTRSAFARVNPRLARFGSFPTALGLALLLGIWTSGLWPRFLLYLHQAPSDMTEPVFGRSVSYYLFSLPLYSALVGWLILTFLLAIGVTLACLVVLQQAGGGQRSASGAAGQTETDVRRGVRALLVQFLVLLSLPLFVLAWNSILNIFRLMYSNWGVVFGPGYVDVHFRVLGYAVTAGALFVSGVLIIVAAASPKFRRKLFGLVPGAAAGSVKLTGRVLIFPASLVVTVILFTGIIPGIVQALVVNPNEITVEAPYLKNSIEFTRAGFGLTDQRIEERQYKVGRDISPPVIAQNDNTLKNVRLWDPRALLANLKQQQEIRLYYEFFDVDIDRYHLQGNYRQVMLSARELEKTQLNPASQTWVSLHFKYTHGYGMVMLLAHDFLPGGGPNLIIRGIPPESKDPRLQVKRPEIYYGEKTRDHVYVHTSQKEFNYPSGDQNVYSTYQGTGGVPMGSPWRRFIFAFRFDSFKQLFSTYIQRESRIMFLRNIKERVAALAPFLRFDRDPYAVLSGDGRIKYILDAYTVSADFPYSDPYLGTLGQFNGLNYVRNSVKVVIDAYDGSVDFYVFDPDDVIIQTYRNIFPELFKDSGQMPPDLQRHVRYPEDFLTVQGEVYSIYHMTDVTTFYQREDVWQFATERYRDNFQAVEPYYMMINFPDEQHIEFVLIIPFTPQNKNVLNAWIAGRSDAPNYGKIIVYTLPKGVEVYGPRQIEARIDQNTEMSRALSLWGQGSSQVIRGNLLAVPLFTPQELYILYVEPIFLQATDAQLPEIKRVAVADTQRVVWAEKFDTAMGLLLGQVQGQAPPAQTAVAAAAGAGVSASARSQIQEVIGAFQDYKDAVGKGDFTAAGQHLERINNLLGSLSKELGQ